MEKGTGGQKLVLGIETATKTGSLAILSGGSVVAQIEFSPGEIVSEVLLRRIGEMFGEAGRSLWEIGLIAVVTGPGSLTGIRVGLAAAVGLSKGLGVRCTGVTAFEALAPVTDEGQAILLLVPAGKLVAWELFRDGARCETGACPDREIMTVIEQTEPARIRSTGDASDKIKELGSLDIVRDIACEAARRAQLTPPGERTEVSHEPVYLSGASFRQKLPPA
jgi:tRNA threonylcarbamoyl adenosine modification protein YeaZ